MSNQKSVGGALLGMVQSANGFGSVSEMIGHATGQPPLEQQPKKPEGAPQTQAATGGPVKGAELEAKRREIEAKIATTEGDADRANLRADLKRLQRDIDLYEEGRRDGRAHR